MEWVYELTLSGLVLIILQELFSMLLGPSLMKLTDEQREYDSDFDEEPA